MDIVLDARTLDDHFPGIGRYTFHLAQALAQRPDLRLTLIIHSRRRDSRFPPPSEAFPTARILAVPYSPFAPQSQWHLARAVAQTGTALYHSPYYIYPYAIRIPRVVTIHDTIPTRFPHYFSPPKRLVIRLLKRLAIHRATHILADSRATAEDVKRFYGVEEARLTVAHLAPAPHFRPQPQEAIARVRERYALPARYFLYVGSAKPHKNVDFLVQVWETMTRQNTSIPLLVLVGLGSQGKGWTSTGAPLRVLGFVPEEELPALYAGARAFLFPSLYEGFGLPVLEAMACGTPVVCHTIPALQEVVGEGGWLLAINDMAGWGEAIMTLAWDDHARAVWSERALARAGAFTWERTAEVVAKVYARLKQ